MPAEVEEGSTKIDPIQRAAGQAQRDAAAAEASGFHLVAELGRGAMGVVYEAIQLRLDRRVALKVMRAELTIDTSYLARFEREARALAKLNHPHIVQVYDQGTVGACLFLALEFVDGEDVARRIARKGRLPVAEALGVALHAARGLQHAHEQGVVHRDVKPANLLVCEAGDTVVAKITDFGLARTPDQSELTHAGTLLGTPAYMAPELTQGDPADASSDLYGLGATLSHMLTGQLPFRATTVVNVLLNKQSPCLANPQSVVSDLPAGTVWVLDRMLARDPEHRYPSYAELIDDLERCLAGEPVRATPVPPDATSFASRPGVRAPGAAKPFPRLAAAVAVCALGVGVWSVSARSATNQTAASPTAPGPAPVVEPGPLSEDGHLLELHAVPADAELVLGNTATHAPFHARLPTGTVTVTARAPGHRPLEWTFELSGDRLETLYLAPLATPLNDDPGFSLSRLEPEERRRLRLLNLSDPNLVLAWDQVGSWSVRRSRVDLAAGTGGLVGEATARGPSVATRDDFAESCALLTERGAAGWRLRWSSTGQGGSLRTLRSARGQLAVGIADGRAFVGVHNQTTTVERELELELEGSEAAFQLDWDGAVATISVSVNGRAPRFLHAVALPDAQAELQLVAAGEGSRFSDFALVALVP